MKRMYWTLFMILMSARALADRYGIHDDYEEYDRSGGRGSGDAVLKFLVIFGVGFLALCYFVVSFDQWQQRQTRQEKPKPKDGIGDWIFTLIGYGLVSLALTAPIFTIIKWTTSYETAREFLWWIFGASTACLTYLRRT